MGIIKNYTNPDAVNPYLDAVRELADAGEGAAYELVVSTHKSETQRGSAQGEKAKFQAAARELGFSARITEAEDREDGTTSFVFVLGSRVTRGKGAAPSE